MFAPDDGPRLFALPPGVGGASETTYPHKGTIQTRKRVLLTPDHQPIGTVVWVEFAPEKERYA